jgi:hypothetical protein
MSTMIATQEREAARLWRRLPAAGRRVRAARERATKHRTLENMTAAAELAAGYARMEAAYYDTLAQVAA